MNTQLPNTDSIRELATFWDTHDIIDFADELEEVQEPVFIRASNTLTIPLSHFEADALQSLADLRGVDAATLVREWVQQHVTPSSQSGAT